MHLRCSGETLASSALCLRRVVCGFTRCADRFASGGLHGEGGTFRCAERGLSSHQQKFSTACQCDQGMNGSSGSIRSSLDWGSKPRRWTVVSSTYLRPKGLACTESLAHTLTNCSELARSAVQFWPRGRIAVHVLKPSGVATRRRIDRGGH